MQVLGAGIQSIIVALGSVYWVDMARVVRGQILSLKQQEFVLAAKTIGSSATTILFDHLIPNALGSILVTITMLIPSAIFMEAFLGYLGIGLQPPLASLGTMCNDASANLRTSPHELLIPALMICVIMFAFNFVGDGLRDALDPSKESKMSETILKVEDLKTSFMTSSGEVQAVRGVSFEVHKGEILGIVGESGSGKSVTSMSILRLLADTARIKNGKIEFEGTDLTKVSDKQMREIRGQKIAMVFQDPMSSLNPLIPVGKQVAEMIHVHHPEMKRDELQAATLELFREVRIPEAEKRLKSYPHEFSGGMRQRVMIAMALANHPDLLIADEPTTALDVTIQHQILKQMRSLQEEYGTSIIFITHDLGVVAELCDRVVVLYGGLVMEEAEINDLFENPLHPYTMGLLASIPGLTKDKSERLQSIPGSPPDMTKPPKGCPFASRCQFARNICAAECPPFVQVGSRQARCWLLQPDAPAEGNPLHEKLAEAERKAH